MFQLGSALLDGCVLAVLAREDAYGYSLTQDIKQVIPVSESTLYPVLRRLQKEDMLTTYDQPHSGRNRRYYRITDNGLRHLRNIQVSWGTFKQGVDTLLALSTEDTAAMHAAEAANEKAQEQMQRIKDKAGEQHIEQQPMPTPPTGQQPTPAPPAEQQPASAPTNAPATETPPTKTAMSEPQEGDQAS